MTHLERRLLTIRDEKLRRCRWCGCWAWNVDPCTACGTSA